MVLINEVEAKVREIRRECKAAISPDTGEVDSAKINLKAEELKQLLHDFETLFIKKAKENPIKAETIVKKGREFLEEGWFTYEVLIELGMKAGEPEPAQVRWEALPEGVVPLDLKAQAIMQLDNLYKKFNDFKKTTLF